MTRLPPDDVEAMRQMLLDLLTENPDLSDMDERLVAMIARIVRGLRQIQFQPRPVILVVSGAQGDGTG